MEINIIGKKYIKVLQQLLCFASNYDFSGIVQVIQKERVFFMKDYFIENENTENNLNSYKRFLSKNIFLTNNFVFKYNLLLCDYSRKKVYGENNGNSVLVYLNTAKLPL